MYSVYFGKSVICVCQSVFNVKVTLVRTCTNTQYCRRRILFFSMAVCCVVEYVHSVSLIIGVYSDFFSDHVCL